MWLETVAGICLAWYLFIILVCSIGYVQLLRHYSTIPAKAISSESNAADVPHVTIIRPVKGLEPYLYECLAATCYQDYPVLKLTIHFCLSSRDDPAHTVLLDLQRDFPAYAIRIFVEEDDPALGKDGGGNGDQSLGPNPKIRNMSRGYREAVGDIVWIIDCNVWVGRGACGRMVDKLYGNTTTGQVKKHKFVHHLPICVDVSPRGSGGERQKLLGNNTGDSDYTSRSSWILAFGGGRLEELFLASSHAKFYTAINTVAVAPCIVGKSNMFRRSHLNYLTSPTASSELSSSDPRTSEALHARNVGLDHFSYNICEDHLIGDLLWRGSIPDDPDISNHGLVFGDLAIQPIAAMGLGAYVARRVRWLRVRKFTVTLATLVEPGTESFLCSAYGAFALTTLSTSHRLGLPTTWSAFFMLWLLSITMWAAVDWTVYLILHSGRTIEDTVSYVPAFARPSEKWSRRPFSQWLLAWLGREALAFPIWAWAFWGGVTVVWRDRKFWVGMDMKVHEVGERTDMATTNGNGHVDARKARID